MFEIETVYDEKTFLEFQDLINGTLRVNRLKITRILFILVGIMSLVLTFMWISAKEPVPAIASGIMAALFLLAGIFFDKYTAMGRRHNINRSIRNITYYFDKENYSAEDSKGLHKSPYTSLVSILESENLFAMMVGKRQGFVLSKDGFKKGTPEEFAEFIQNKTGLTLMKPTK